MQTPLHQCFVTINHIDFTRVGGWSGFSVKSTNDWTNREMLTKTARENTTYASVFTLENIDARPRHEFRAILTAKVFQL